MFVEHVFELVEIFSYLEVRGLTKQYQKAKQYLLSGYYTQINFKLRQPKEKGIYSFRINKQFRAFGIIREREMRIFEINNHQ